MKLGKKTDGVTPIASDMPDAIQRENRRLALLKRAGLFGDKMNGARLTRACTLTDLRQAYRLVYETFLDAGYIAPSNFRMRIRTFEACGETATFVARTDSEVVGVQSLVLDSPDLGLPADLAFGPELDALRSKGLKLSEATNEAVTPAFRRTAVMTELMRCFAAQALLSECDLSLTAVSPNHRGFYELIGFRQIAPERSYSDDVDDPVVLLCYDMQNLREKASGLTSCQNFVRDYLSFKSPIVAKAQPWQLKAVQCFHNANFLRSLCVEESNLLEDCTDLELAALRDRWGEDLFAEVIAPSVATTPTGRYIPVKPPAVKTRGHMRLSSPASPIS